MRITVVCCKVRFHRCIFLKMDFTVPFPPLKELCLIQTAICLWSAEDVVQLILDHEQEIQNKETRASHRGNRRKTTEGQHLWTKFKNHITNNLDNLPLPSMCKTMIIKYIDPIGCQIERWLIDSTPFEVESKFFDLLSSKHAGYYFRHFSWFRVRNSVTTSMSPSQRLEHELTQFYLTRLAWTCLGVIDGSKLAPLIVRDKRIKISHRYFVAYSHNMISEMYELNHDWTRDILVDLYEKHRDEKFYSKDFAVKFLWSSLSKDDKESLIDHCHPHLISAHTMLFLLNRMQCEEQVKFLERGAYISLLKWPYLNLFTHVSKNYRQLLPDKLIFTALTFLWEIVEYKGYESVEGETFKSYLTIIPLNVVLLFAACKLAFLLFLANPLDYTLYNTYFRENFSCVLEREFKVQYDLKCGKFLLNIHKDFTEEQETCRDNLVQLIKSMITHYVEGCASEESDLENSVEECCDVLELELRHGPYSLEFIEISKLKICEAKKHLLQYLRTLKQVS